ncbi:homoserine dehydrogenase [Taibaiella soli]|uniref:Homoserine dehydrogenase n=1 Tax=Taibaiella soli TaxID=1649169 RepID=A0A2W2AYP5_9BACT|nr:homoserine dehydrogenase [Taibaiella soli]PZF72778.1 homoserine dehydrogenase [Taibaiella soli]
MSIQQKQLNIGLFGFGVVGEGLYKVLQQTASLNASITKVCIKHPEKKRNAPAELFTTDAEVLLNDPSINVIIELIDDADAAFYIVSRALKSGKAVVSANKKLIAEHLPELLALQKENKTPFLYEAGCCASIPVIRNLEEYYDNDLLQGVQGIVNGSTNYILTRIAEDGLSFAAALKLAQDEGFAESNPALDIEGIDAVNKLTLLLVHAYGIVSHPTELVHSGIHLLHAQDAVFAKEKQYEIKLVAQAKKLRSGKVAAFVLPQFITKENQLYNVKNEYNGVVIESGLADKQFFYGKGAGGFPTASAVLSDLSALRYGYKYEYKKKNSGLTAELTDDFYLRVYVSFDGLFQVRHELFERIEEWTSNDKRCSIVGIVHFSRLKSDWWKNNNTSLILYPDAILEKEEVEGLPAKQGLKNVLEHEIFA